MSTLVETFVTALVLSGLAALGLALLPQAPPRLKLAIATAGLGAWLVPWGLIRAALPDATLALPLAVALGTQRTAQSPQALLDAGNALPITFVAATLIGLAMFVCDCAALRRCVRRWRANSRAADELRSLLPPELASLRAEIRVVADSNVAAASGYFEPTIWIGDGYAGEQLRLTVLHEMCHVRGRDPLRLALLGAVRRAYWWNPLVAHLARQATLMLESICDHRSAAAFGKRRYTLELASLVLAGAAPAPALIASVHAASLDVQRVRLLSATLRVRARDVAVLAALGGGAAATALTNVATHGPAVPLPPSAPTAVAPSLPRTARAGGAEVLDDLLSSYAYTPQQHLGDSDAAP